MTLLAQVMDVVATAGQGVADVATRWDVVAAAFVGGLTREVWSHRKDGRKMRAAAAEAVSAHERKFHATLAAATAGKE